MPTKIGERDFFPELSVRSELELQAHWFNGDFGENFFTRDGRAVRVLQFGIWNRESGPDFIEAAVQIADGPIARGAIELDTDVRDWERHAHATNEAYNDVVLHLFFESPRDEMFTRTSDHRMVPQVQLDTTALRTTQPPVPPLARPGLCCAPLRQWAPEDINTLLHTSAQFRLTQKASALRRLEKLHGRSEMLYQSTAIALGYKENKLPFQLLAQRLPLSRLRSAGADAESLLFGVAGLLNNPDLGTYSGATRDHVRRMWEKWWEHRGEFQCIPPKAWKAGGMRPANHPQRRLGALAAIVANWRSFQDRMLHGSLANIMDFLVALEDDYWCSHYTLTSSTSEKRIALIGDTRARDIIANIVMPLRMDEGLWEEYTRLIAPLDNRKVLTAATRLFGPETKTRRDLRHLVQHQGLLQIYEDFCLRDHTDCRECRFPGQLAAWPFRNEG